jgi:hypothetical protein
MLTELGEVLGGDGVLVILVVVADGEERRVELLELHHVLVPQVGMAPNCFFRQASPRERGKAQHGAILVERAGGGSRERRGGIAG